MGILRLILPAVLFLLPPGTKLPGRFVPAFGGPSAGGDETIWVEGEDAAKSTFQKHGWYDGVKKDVLSGQNWLSHYGPQPGEASWPIDARDGGEYAFWVRCNTTWSPSTTRSTPANGSPATSLPSRARR